MTLPDMFELAFDNLRRTKLRTGLTTSGVVIGIGALTSMVAFGTGMQRNITDAFKQNDLFTSMFVTAKAINFERVTSGDPDDMASMLKGPTSSLTDSTLEALGAIPGVEIAFPEISFPIKVRMGGKETTTTLRALPAAMGQFKPYSKITFGEFFKEDSALSVVASWDVLEELGLLVQDGKHPVKRDQDDSTGARVVEADSVIGRPIEVISVVLDVSRVAGGPMFGLLRPVGMPTREVSTSFTVGGVLKRSSTFSAEEFRGGVLAPLRSAEAIPRLGFSSVFDLLGGGGKPGTYSTIYVRVKRMADTQSVRDAIEKAGLNVFSFADQLKEIRRGFLVVDSILGAVGTIALIVAALGIANTMVMSILERTREIGIMKAIGGSEGEIKTIFFVEAATIGVMGALLGLVLGWGVTRVANLVVNARLMPEAELPVNLFYFPVWLILGAIGFSVVVSLAAGLYPAFRAARIDPVEALRHD